MKKILISILLSLCLLSLCYAQASQSVEPEPAVTQESGTPQASPAASKGLFSIEPANKNSIKRNQTLVEMKPGDYYENALLAKNLTDTEIALHLYASDGIIVKDRTDKIAAKMDTDTQEYAGKWTRFEDSEVTLAPKEEKEIKFMILVPEKTPLGIYKGGLSAVYKVPSDGGSVQFAMRYLLGTTITVTDDPQPIPMESKPGLVDIFTSGTPYLWGSVGLFVVGMGYFIYGSMQEKKKKKVIKKS